MWFWLLPGQLRRLGIPSSFWLAFQTLGCSEPLAQLLDFQRELLVRGLKLGFCAAVDSFSVRIADVFLLLLLLVLDGFVGDPGSVCGSTDGRIPAGSLLPLLSVSASSSWHSVRVDVFSAGQRWSIALVSSLVILVMLGS